MRLKGRLKRLEREVHWLKYEGWLRSLEMQMKLLEQMAALEKHKAALKAKADRPPPPTSPAPAPAPPSPPPAPVKAPLVEAPPPCPTPEAEPVVVPFVYDPPEHMQIRPVTWRIRGPDDEDDWDDDDDDLGPYQTVTEYDPLDDS